MSKFRRLHRALKVRDSCTGSKSCHDKGEKQGGGEDAGIQATGQLFIKLIFQGTGCLLQLLHSKLGKHGEDS